MYSARMNIDTQMIEILKNGYVQTEIPYADWSQYADVITTGYNQPGTMRKVRNLPPPRIISVNGIPHMVGLPLEDKEAEALRLLVERTKNQESNS